VPVSRNEKALRVIAPVLYSDGLGLPFVPFTFPTVLFSRLAGQYGYTNLTWGEVDKIWGLYSAGRASGDLSRGGFNDAAVVYLVSQGVTEYNAASWLGMAEVAAESWWGQGSYFSDFGGSPGVVGAASGLVQGAVDAVRAVGDGIVSGIARGLGVPRWIMWGIFGLGALLLGWFLIRVYLPRARRAF
jgi:hypothetical protein